jgi:hypothetical protein
MLVEYGGGVEGKGLLTCRKVGFWGSVGETYFEQPSMNLIQSGLWSCSDMKPRLVRIETFSSAYSDPFEAIRFFYCT